LLIVSHPFGTPEEIERVNFRKLARHLQESKQIPERSFDLLNRLYDIGNRYVHPKSAQDPKADSRQTLLFLGEALWGIYGCPGLAAGMTLETAYSSFPDICSSHHFWMDGFASPEAAFAAEAGREHCEGGAGQQQGVGPDDRSPSAPDRRSTP
jgi:hypothetical protein